MFLSFATKLSPLSSSSGRSVFANANKNAFWELSNTRGFAADSKSEKKKFERVKPHINIGTIGHVDHGKTTLTAAITKILSEVPELNGKANYVPYEEIDKAPEEKSRGITIATSHIEYETAHKHLTHIDCPGHSDYVKNMITGTAQMDTAILVVSAPDGIMPQTREHVMLARNIGVKSMVIFVNKADMVKDPELQSFIHFEVIDVLKHYGYDGELVEKFPCVKGSALWAMKPFDTCNEEEKELGRGRIVELIKTLDEMPLPERPLNLPLMMPVENAFTLTGKGIVATGKIEQGTVKLNDMVEVVGVNPGPIQAPIGSIEMFHKLLDVGEAGENVGLLLKGLKKEDVYRGQVVCKPGSLKGYRKFKSTVFMLSKDEGGRAKPFGNNYKPQFFFRTADITGAVVLDKPDAMVMPGDHAEINVELICPLALVQGLRFTIREGGRTIGAGIVTGVIEDDPKAKKGGAAAKGGPAKGAPAKPGAAPAKGAPAKGAAAAKGAPAKGAPAKGAPAKK